MSSPIDSSQWMYNAGGGFYDHPIDQSLRFEDGDSAKLVIDPTQDGDKQKWTWSGWVKRGNLGLDYAVIFSGNNSSGHQTDIRFEGEDTLRLITATSALSMNVITTRLFRDISSWFHLVVAIDTTQSTLTNRFKVYVNGVQETSFSATTCTQNHNCVINTASSVTHNVGANGYNTSVSSEFDGYLAEVHFVDGTQYAASEFGETKSGVWIPKSPSVTYGTNGFHMKFDQTGTSANSSGIGADSSGNDHHFTVINLVASDVVPDSPTNNFPTFNNLLYHGTTYSEGNLKNASPGNDWETQVATMFPSTLAGKWYAEFYVHTCNASGTRVGVGVTDEGNNPEDYLGNESPDVAYYDINDFYTGGSKTADSNLTFAAGDIISVALNLDDGEVTFRKNNSTMTNGTQNLIANTLYTFASTNYGSGSGVVANFGQDSSFAGNKTSGSASAADGNGQGDFFYAPPSGFLSLCSSNLPEPTIGPNSETQADDHFNTVLWTGNGSDGRSITGVGFDPDFVWIRSRNLATSHLLNDTIRGANKTLFSEGTNAETADNGGGYLSAFVTDGFSVTSGGSGDNAVNDSSDTYVAWNWLAGTAFSNDASATGVGSIDSEGQVNTTAGFSIIKFTTDGETSGTVAHGLGVQPQLLIGKTRNHVVPWYVQTPLLATNLAGILNATDAFYNPGYNHWNDTHPTTSVFSVGGYMADHADLTNPSTKIVYCFANVEGYSKIGTYEGNGNNDGTFVYTGFRPAFLLVKSVDSTSDWLLVDDKRIGYNAENEYIEVNNANAEGTVNMFDLVSNGFKNRDRTADPNVAETYLYIAFASQPFKYANAR